MISRFFTNQLVVRKLKGTGYKRVYQSTATVDGHVQKLDDDKAQVLNMVSGQAFIGWLPTDLSFVPCQDDQITDHQGRQFKIKTVEKWDFGINQHYEMIMERYDPQND